MHLLTLLTLTCGALARLPYSMRYRRSPSPVSAKELLPDGVLSTRSYTNTNNKWLAMGVTKRGRLPTVTLSGSEDRNMNYELTKYFNGWNSWQRPFNLTTPVVTSYSYSPYAGGWGGRTYITRMFFLPFPGPPQPIHNRVSIITLGGGPSTKFYIRTFLTEDTTTGLRQYDSRTPNAAFDDNMKQLKKTLKSEGYSYNGNNRYCVEVNSWNEPETRFRVNEVWLEAK